MARTPVRPPAGWDDKDNSSSDSSANKSDGDAVKEKEESPVKNKQTDSVEPDLTKPKGDTPAS
jgi:cell division protease FtsH